LFCVIPRRFALFFACLSDADLLGTLLSEARHLEETILVRQAGDIRALVQMDGVELASCGADSASETSVLVDMRSAASEASCRLGFDLSLGEGEPVVCK